jgi:hypothetical protein
MMSMCKGVQIKFCGLCFLVTGDKRDLGLRNKLLALMQCKFFIPEYRFARFAITFFQNDTRPTKS